MAKISINLSKGSVESNPNASKPQLILGIDLGTTNSLIAHVEQGQAKIIKDQNHQAALLPSVLYFEPNGDLTVGQAALEKRLSQPQRTIASVKRLLGKSLSDLAQHRELFAYELIDNPQDEQALVRVRIDQRYYSPVELSAQILQALKQRASQALGQVVEKAVITVPAYFNDAQRQATRDAGKLAGLDILRIINEPTAAALAYGLHRGEQAAGYVAVYDLGGGTFDLSILRLEAGIFEVLATHGDTFLGGDDIDQAIVKHWQKTLDPSQDFDPLWLRHLADQAKRALSQNETWEGTLPSGLLLRLNQTELAQCLQPILDKTLACCRQALLDAQLEASQIEAVVLVGGPTRLPLIRQAVADFFGRQPYTELNPDEVVALGAAIQADILAGNQKDMLLLDVTPLSLGIETLGGLMDVIVPRNTKIPIRYARQYSTSVDGQVNLKVAVYQGERDLVADNRKLGEFILRGIPPMPAGLPKIEIQFLLDADGILRVKAKELRSGTEQTVEIRAAYALSETEMGRMLLESVQQAKGDMNRRALIEAQNEAQALDLATQKFLNQNAAWLPLEAQAEMLRLKEVLQKLKQGQDKDAILQGIEILNNYARPYAEQAMETTIASAMKGQNLVDSQKQMNQD